MLEVPPMNVLRRAVRGFVTTHCRKGFIEGLLEVLSRMLSQSVLPGFGAKAPSKMGR